MGRGRLLGALAFGLAAATAAPACASGNEHTVDDSEVEDPGSCHVELWGTHAAHRLDLLNLGPSCTPRRLPRLEFGGALQQVRYGPHARDTLVGPAIKATLRPQSAGLGLGVTFDSLHSARTGAADSANLLGEMTLPLGKALRVNLTAGAAWARTDHRTQPFAGAQVEAQLPGDLALMAEAYERRGETLGGQVGLRWTPRQGKVDYDLVVGRRVDGFSDTAISLGVTVRT